MRRKRRTHGSLIVLALIATAVSTAGCRSTLDVSRLGFKSEEEKLAEMTRTDDIKGPLERIIPAAATQEGRRMDDSGRLQSAAGAKELEAALAELKAGKTWTGERHLKKIVKTYRESPVAEEAQFQLAESQFNRQRYSLAQDSYDELVKQFPSTRYLDQVTRRMFTIGRTWLQFPEIVTSNDVQQVNFENPKATPPPEPGPRSADPTRIIPILPNFVNRSRPVFDTEGRALQALKSIWLNDPTGPLADDALMLTASHYLRAGDYLEADHIYSILREEYPKSPHLENAFVLGSHVKLMTYQGAAYDGKQLEHAEQLKESTLRLYQDHPQADRMRGELRKIYEAKAKREWETVEFYESKDNPQAVAIYCREVIKHFPQSTYADRARQRLVSLQREGLISDSSAVAAAPQSRPVPRNPEPVEPPEPKPSAEPLLQRLNPLKGWSAPPNPLKNLGPPKNPLKRLLPKPSDKTPEPEVDPDARLVNGESAAGRVKL